MKKHGLVTNAGYAWMKSSREGGQPEQKTVCLFFASLYSGKNSFTVVCQPQNRFIKDSKSVHESSHTLRKH